MQTRLSTLHEKVLRHDYTKYAYVYIVFLGPENKRKRGKRRTSRRPRNQKGIACREAANANRREEKKRKKKRRETEKYQKGEEKERDGEKDRADRDEAKVCTRARIHGELWQQPSTRVRTLVTVFSNTMQPGVATASGQCQARPFFY